MLKKAYIEITNRCNLRCDFCPGTRRTLGEMTAADFRTAGERLRPYVGYFYLHVMGEPLLHPELREILAICSELDAKVCLTTNGTLLPARRETLLAAPALHKVSVSLHSMEGNGAMALTDYLGEAWSFACAAAERGIICALRLWNLGGAEARNGEIFSFLEERIGQPPLCCPQPRRGSWRLGERLYLELAERFDWPDLAAQETGAAFCQALRSQVAVLVDGTVVPCCLDHEGDIPLGNIFLEELPAILQSPRAKALYDGFSRRQPSEALCRRCGFAKRFG